MVEASPINLGLPTEILYNSYKDGKYDSHRAIKGLSVKTTNQKNGASLSEDMCEENMGRAYEKAKKLWNESDQSDRPRLV